jgi:hypothetical protein
MLSGDNITVLAGQNEAGKTAVLLALRDFDLPSGKPALTPEFVPEGNFEARPRVAVLFKLEDGDVDVLREYVEFPEFFDRLGEVESLWVERDLLSGSYSFDPTLSAIWSEAEKVRAEKRNSADLSSTEVGPDSADVPAGEAQGESKTEESITQGSVGDTMRRLWPAFVYFDSFHDTLPKEVDVDALLAPEGGARQAGQPVVSQAVRDFVALSGVDAAKVKELATQDKALGNYLQSRGASITGDFLTYWKQTIDGEQSVNLQVRHARDAAGVLKLTFYVRDQVDQYPEQRSKGFVWFLSFYLRLAAAQKRRNAEGSRLLLIDEPGSYLHARAQRDVLHLFETRIAPTEPIIYSSHSQFLMPPERLHRMRIVMKSRDNGTRVYDRLTHPDLRGEAFVDTLTPIIQAIGIDITQALSFVGPKNLLVEGITDHIYVTNWARLYRPAWLDTVNVFPGFGATTLPILGSLFIGWGLSFAILLDRDAEAAKTRDKLVKELLVPESRVVQPRDAMSIEDIFSADDFGVLLTSVDPTLTIQASETPSAAIKRQGIDKVLLARAYAQRVSDDGLLTPATKQRIGRLLDDLTRALE